jgi:hypothetical protein
MLLFDLLAFAVEVLLADVAEQLNQGGGAGKERGRQDRVQFCDFGLLAGPGNEW